MKNFLVPVDFSPNALRALKAAATLAKVFGARLFVLHAFQPFFSEGTLGGESINATADLEDAFKADLRKYVDDLQKEGVTAEAVWAVGGVAEVVKDRIAELKPEMVIVGRTGRGSFVDKLFGTSVTDIVKVSSVPVLVVPPQSNPVQFKEIVYATQLEYEERSTIAKVMELSRQLGGRLSFFKASALTQPNIQDDRHFIKEITGSLGLRDEDFEIREAGSVPGGIVAYAEEVKADLLVVASRSRGFLERLFIDPSVTSKLIVNTSVPLLIYHLENIGEA